MSLRINDCLFIDNVNIRDIKQRIIYSLYKKITGGARRYRKMILCLMLILDRQSLNKESFSLVARGYGNGIFLIKMICYLMTFFKCKTLFNQSLSLYKKITGGARHFPRMIVYLMVLFSKGKFYGNR